MKKLLLILLGLLAVSLIMTPVALASDDYYSVSDTAGLLTQSQKTRLNERAEALTEKYGCEVVIIAIEDLRDLGFNPDYDANAAYECAKYIHRELGYGYGPEKSCVMLFFSAAGGKGNRDYALIAYGYGNTAFTDYGKDVMLNKHVLPLLGQDKYYDAFSIYLDKAGEYLALARNGNPFDVGSDSGQGAGAIIFKLVLIILLPALIAWAVCSNWKSKMKTAKIAQSADNYIPKNGFNLTNQEDTFLYRTTTRRKIEQSSSSSGGGGTTTDSGGYSGSSGKI